VGVCLRHHAVGVVVVVIAHGVILNVDVDHAEYEEADIRKLLLILGVLTVHSFPEGVAIAIPLRTMDVPERRMVWWAVFSSLPQPVGAAVAFAFVRLARRFLPFGFGFAAGATTYLVFTEFIPEAWRRAPSFR
jgi:ZIP family zinc transporter